MIFDHPYNADSVRAAVLGAEMGAERISTSYGCLPSAVDLIAFGIGRRRIDSSFSERELLHDGTRPAIVWLPRLRGSGSWPR